MQAGFTIRALLAVSILHATSLARAQDSADETPVTEAAVPETSADASTAAAIEEPTDTPQTGDAEAATQDIPTVEVAPEAPVNVGTSVAATAMERVRFYGFGDFNYAYWQGDRTFSEFIPSRTKMFLGNLNFFVDVQVAEDWRALTEVRLLFFPQGVEQSVPGSFELQEVNARVRDYKDSNSQMTWMTLEIERAWLEHSIFGEGLKLRAGLWKTPYGIWNIEHASPAVIGIGRPYAAGQGLMPERQLGLQLLGTYSGDSWALNYSLAVSNGRMDNQAAYENVDDQFSFTGRLGIDYYGDFEFSAGMSAFGGRFADKNRRGAIMDGGFRMVTDSVTAYDEVSLSADLQLRYAGFTFLSEAVMQDVSYTDNGRPLAAAPLTGQVANERRLAVYALLGYLFEEWNTMPYTSFDYLDSGDNMELVDSYIARAGIKQGLSDSVFLKVQGNHIWWKYGDPNSIQGESVNSLQAELSWGF